MNLSRINLLDWRTEARERKRRRFLSALMLAALLSVILAGVLPVLYYNHLIEEQRSRNDFLQRQIDLADEKLVEIRELQEKREDLITRMRVIEQLQKSRSEIVHYFDQLVDTIPNGVFLTSLTQKNNGTSLDGVAESNVRVSDYMVNFEDSPWFANPQLIVIRSSENGPERFADFTLNVNSDRPSDDNAGNQQSGSGSNPSASDS